MKTSNCLTLLVAFWAAAVPSVGLAQEDTIATFTLGRDVYSVRQWTTDSGLPSNHVLGIEQTPDGYLWVATMAGLARFDGARFTMVDSASVRGTPRGIPTIIKVDTEGTLWAYFSDGEGEHALARLREGVWEVVHRPTSTVSGMSVAPDGAIWYAAGSGTRSVVVRWFDGTATEIDLGFSPQQILVDRSGTVWVGAIGSVARVVGGVVHPVAIPNAEGSVVPLLEDRAGRIWFAGFTGTWYLDGDAVEGFEPGGQPPIASMVEDDDGHIWRGDAGHRVTRVTATPQSKPDPSSVAEAYSTGSVPNSSLVDQDGTIWFGLNSRGLLQVRKNKLPALMGDKPDADQINAMYIYGVAPRHDGAVWIGDFCRPRILRSDGQMLPLGDGFPKMPMESVPGAERLVPAVPADTMFSDTRCVVGLAEHSNGVVWLLRGSNVLSRLEDGVLTDYAIRDHLPGAAPPPGLMMRNVWLTVDTTGDAWFVQQGVGIVHVSADGEQTLYAIDEGPDGREGIDVLKPGISGDVWFGTRTRFGRLSADGVKQWETEEWLAGAVVTDVYVDAEGVAWVGSGGGGLLRIDGSQLTRLTRTDGLVDENIFRILETNDGDLWIASGSGIMVLERERVLPYLQGEVDSLDIGVLRRGDGAPEMRRPQASGAVGVDGRMWLVGSGAMVVDPSEIRWNDDPPTVIVEAITVDGEAVLSGGEAIVPPGATGIEIRYTAPVFDDPDYVSFRYRLDDYDSSWVDAGNRRFTSYTGLWPGEYTFRVRARRNHGPWTETGAAVVIRVLPLWWQTTWALVVAVLGFMALGAGIQTLRTRSVHRRNIVLEREIAAREAAEVDLKDLGKRMISAQEDDRARIARELHDDVSQRLAAASIGLELSAGAVRADPGAAEEQLRALQGQLDQVSEDVRRVSHELHPSVLENLGLATALEVLCEELQSQTGVAVRLGCEGPASEVPGEVALCIYRVTQEALHNVGKHAEAESAKVEVSTTAEYVRLRIRDDGIGFDADSRQPGLGLASIRERARLLDGSVRVRSEPGGGTEVVVRIPLDALP